MQCSVRVCFARCSSSVFPVAQSKWKIRKLRLCTAVNCTFVQYVVDVRSLLPEVLKEYFILYESTCTTTYVDMYSNMPSAKYSRIYISTRVVVHYTYSNMPSANKILKSTVRVALRVFYLLKTPNIRILSKFYEGS